MREIIRKHHISFKNAFSGVFWAVKTQPNFRVHLSLALLAIFLGRYFQISSVQWILLIFTIFWGLAAEMINTAIESVCDLVTKQQHQEIKIAKDVAAGMMLVVALGTVCVGLMIFGPKIVDLLSL